MSLSGDDSAVWGRKGKRKAGERDVLICSVSLWLLKPGTDFKFKAFNQIEISFPMCAHDVRGGIIILLQAIVYFYHQKGENWFKKKKSNNMKMKVKIGYDYHLHLHFSAVFPHRPVIWQAASGSHWGIQWSAYFCRSKHKIEKNKYTRAPWWPCSCNIFTLSLIPSYNNDNYINNNNNNEPFSNFQSPSCTVSHKAAKKKGNSIIVLLHIKLN